jgi:ATP-dependent DNA helicase RecG
MNPSIEKLTKFLRLEAERGHDNRAVMGGLERMLESWDNEARQNSVPDPIIEVVVTRLRDYPKLTPGSRKEALQGLWHRLSEAFPEIKSEFASRATDAQSEQPTIGDIGTSEHPEEKDEEAAPEAPVHEPKIHVPLSAEEPASLDDEEEEQEPQPTEPPASLVAPLTTVPGIGPKSAKTLKKLDLQTLGDLLWHLPRRYDDYSQLETINRLWYGQEVTVIAAVEHVNVRPVRSGRMKLVEAVVSDGTGTLNVVWFNQAWIATRLRSGKPIVLSGKIDQYLGRLTMNNPEWEPLERNQLHTNRIVPVYPLTSGVTAKWLRRVINSVVTRLAPRIPDPLPDNVRNAAELLPLTTALRQVHFPDNWEMLKKAQHRIAFDEMLLLQLGVLEQKRAWTGLETQPLDVDPSHIERFRQALPYKLTEAQSRSFDEVFTDLSSGRPMNRLLQGDVGSGKTVVAAVAVAVAAFNEAQSAIMAPTSILAEQHFNTMMELLPHAAGLAQNQIRLLLGATPEDEKKEIREGLKAGAIKLVIGTHALIEDPVAFQRLALAIIDEQHRFGVDQRAALRTKGENPNLLVMTATPIPRSLALTIYGDLDLSVIDEMPPGRPAVKTRVMDPIERGRAYNYIQSQIEEGRQAFMIFPLVEGSEKIQAKAATEEHERLQKEVFPDLKLGLLHGRMKQVDKEATMARFRSGEYDILVSTSVVEVGIDIPNASVMLIEGANRFGLAQLHQFRGRVGRGPYNSYCLLISDADAEKDNERLKAMEKTSDGFELAEIDLKQRGPGEFLGTRQSGFSELKAARLTDIRLIDKARRIAQQIFDSDPELQNEEHKLLSETMRRFWAPGKGELS